MLERSNFLEQHKVGVLLPEPLEQTLLAGTADAIDVERNDFHELIVNQITQLWLSLKSGNEYKVCSMVYYSCAQKSCCSLG